MKFSNWFWPDSALIQSDSTVKLANRNSFLPFVTSQVDNDQLFSDHLIFSLDLSYLWMLEAQYESMALILWDWMLKIELILRFWKFYEFLLLRFFSVFKIFEMCSVATVIITSWANNSRKWTNLDFEKTLTIIQIWHFWQLVIIQKNNFKWHFLTSKVCNG